MSTTAVPKEILNNKVRLVGENLDSSRRDVELFPGREKGNVRTVSRRQGKQRD